MQLGLIVYGPSTIYTKAFWSNAFGPPIYGKIALGPNYIWAHISSMDAFGPDSIWAEYYYY